MVMNRLNLRSMNLAKWLRSLRWMGLVGGKVRWRESEKKGKRVKGRNRVGEKDRENRRGNSTRVSRAAVLFLAFLLCASPCVFCLV